MNTEKTRPFVTMYFTLPDASGKQPSSVGYAASLNGARRNMASRIVFGQFSLAIVKHKSPKREDSLPLCIIRKTGSGLSIRDI